MKDHNHDSEHEHTEEVITRLSKIEGHIRSIKKMLEDGKPCDQVLIQLAAVKSAVNGATKVLLEDHFDHCLISKNRDKALGNELEEFRKILGGFLK